MIIKTETTKKVPKLRKTKIFLSLLLGATAITSFFAPLMIQGPKDPEPYKSKEIPKSWLLLNDDKSIVSGIVASATDLSRFDTLRLPESVTTVSTNAFLDQFTLTKNSTISKLIIGPNVKTINESAFEHWDTLKSITISPGNAYFDCWTNVSVDGGEHLGQFLMPMGGLTATSSTFGAAWGSVEFSEENLAFSNTTIGPNCFKGARAVDNFDLKNITLLGNGALADLPKITELKLKKITSIGNKCFSQDKNVKFLSGEYDVLPTIGTNVFENWSRDGIVDNTGTITPFKLYEKVIDPSKQDLWTYSLGPIPYSYLELDEAKTTVYGLKPGVDVSRYTSLNIWPSIITIAPGAFENDLSLEKAPSITTLSISSSVTSINQTKSATGHYAFAGWENLHNIELSPENKTFKLVTFSYKNSFMLIPKDGIDRSIMASPIVCGQIDINTADIKDGATVFDNDFIDSSALERIYFFDGITSVKSTISNDKNLIFLHFEKSIVKLDNFNFFQLPSFQYMGFESFPQIISSLNGSDCPKFHNINFFDTVDFSRSWDSDSFSDFITTGLILCDNNSINFEPLKDKFKAAGLDLDKWIIFNDAIQGPSEITNTAFYGNGNNYAVYTTIPSFTGVWKLNTNVSGKSISLKSNGDQATVITEGQYTKPDPFSIEICFDYSVTVHGSVFSGQILKEIKVVTVILPLNPALEIWYDATSDEYNITGTPDTDAKANATEIICPDFWDDGTNGTKIISQATQNSPTTSQSGWGGYTKLKSLKFGRFMHGALNKSSPTGDGGNCNIFWDSPVVDIYIPYQIINWSETMYGRRGGLPRPLHSKIPTDWSAEYYNMWVLVYSDNTPTCLVDPEVYSLLGPDGALRHYFTKRKNIIIGSEEKGSKCRYIPARNLCDPYLSLVSVVCWAKTPPELTYGDVKNLNEVFNAPGGVLESIKVPAESVEAYKTAPGWKNAADKISAI